MAAQITEAPSDCYDVPTPDSGLCSFVKYSIFQKCLSTDISQPDLWSTFLPVEYKSTDANIIHIAGTDTPIFEGAGHKSAEAIILKPSSFQVDRYQGRVFEGDVFFNTLRELLAESCFIRR